MGIIGIYVMWTLPLLGGDIKAKTRRDQLSEMPRK